MTVYEHKRLADALRMSGASDVRQVRFISWEGGYWRVGV